MENSVYVGDVPSVVTPTLGVTVKFGEFPRAFFDFGSAIGFSNCDACSVFILYLDTGVVPDISENEAGTRVTAFIL